MKILGLTVMAFLALSFANRLNAVVVGDVGPNFKFEKSWNFDPSVVELANLRGKVVMIESWATW